MGNLVIFVASKGLTHEEINEIIWGESSKSKTTKSDLKHQASRLDEKLSDSYRFVRPV